MSRKLVALFLVLTLAMGMCAQASASTKYNCTFMSKMDASTSSMTMTEEFRYEISGLLLIDYALTVPGASISNISSSGYGYIVVWPSHLDIYYRLTSGKYLNLFYCPSDATFTDYGTSSSVSENGYTSKSFSMSSMWVYINSVLND